MLQSMGSGPVQKGDLGLETAENRTEVAGPHRPAPPVSPVNAGRSARPLAPADSRPLLAIFCYEAPDSVVGQFVTQIARALAKRQVAVHIFSRRDFDLDALGIGSHALGVDDGDDLVEHVKEFAGRACSAFLKIFPVGSAPVTLLGVEWSSVPALSLLRSLKKLDVFLSLHSLERQRGDLSSDLSRQIEEIERTGLREAKTVLVHGPAAAEAARATAPECSDRIVPVREVFPSHFFEPDLDPGSIKARYQIAPLEPMLVFVGDLSQRYGPDLLVKAMPAVLRNHPGARLVVVGEGARYWPLRVFAPLLLLEHAVRLVGNVEGQPLHELIRAADLVVVPSREPTPWWPIQAAWAARRPVVAAHPAAPGLLEHEQDGVLVYPSENSCVWGIERVFFDGALRQNLAEKGAGKLDERFGWGGVAAQVKELMVAAAVRGAV